MPFHLYRHSRFLALIFTLLIALAIALSWPVNVLAEDGDDMLRYTVDVRIDPETQHLSAEVLIENPPETSFDLNPVFDVTRVSADGQTVNFSRESDTSSNPPRPGRTVTVSASSPHSLKIAYEGTLKEVVSNVNMITPDLVELALYAAWFPLFDGMVNFEYILHTDLPTDFTTTTNGNLLATDDRNGRTQSTWASFKPDFDIALVASPVLHEFVETSGATSIEQFYATLPREKMQEKAAQLVCGLDRLTERYGQPRVEGILRFVYAPRSGWGYSRIPLFVMSEEYATSILAEPSGTARDFHGAAHEMAHFWWSIAPMDTRNDWINEGLAEYSAFRLSEEMYGDAFAQELITEYRTHATESAHSQPIIETPNDSDDRYVNRYEKTTLLFIEAGRRYGRERVENVFRTLHERYAGTRDLTTPIFLTTVREQLGTDAESFFRDILTNPDWTGFEITVTRQD